jgi:hypothetical protein
VFRTRPRTPELDRQGRREVSGISEPPADQRRARKAPAAPAWRASRTKLRPHVRNRSYAKNPPAAARQHHQTVAHSCRCVQSWPGDAENIGMRNPERLPGRPECVSDLYSAAVESLCKRHTATMASIRASRGNFAEKRDAFSNACSLPASRHSVFENQFSHGLLGANRGPSLPCGFTFREIFRSECHTWL